MVLRDHGGRLSFLAGLLPDLSGLIREHAALLVNNPTLPLLAMPFAPV
jgi:hypothetical protein